MIRIQGPIIKSKPMFSPGQRLYQQFSFDFSKQKAVGTYDTGINFPNGSLVRVVTIFVQNAAGAVTVNAGCVISIGTFTNVTLFTPDIVTLLTVDFALYGGPAIVGEGYLVDNAFVGGAGVARNYFQTFGNVVVDISVAAALTGKMFVGFEYILAQ